MGVYFIYSEFIDLSGCCYVHLHNIENDTGTTFFFGQEPGFAMGMSSISPESLFSAVGSDIFNDITTLKNG